MPILTVTSNAALLEEISQDAEELRSMAANELSVEEWPIDETHISLRFNSVSGALIGEVELELIAHQFGDRVARKDEVCSRIRSHFEKRWKREVRVWMHLVEMGYGTKR